MVSNRLKKFHNNSHKKSFQQNKLMKMSKSKKVHISVTFFLITFCMEIFQLFNGLEIRIKFCVFDTGTSLTKAQIFFFICSAARGYESYHHNLHHCSLHCPLHCLLLGQVKLYQSSYNIFYIFFLPLLLRVSTRS